MLDTPTPPPTPVDPNLAAEQEQARNDMASSLQHQSQGDMASLMARYGTQLALAGGGGGSPLAATNAMQLPGSGMQSIGRGL